MIVIIKLIGSGFYLLREEVGIFTRLLILCGGFLGKSSGEMQVQIELARDRNEYK